MLNRHSNHPLSDGYMHLRYLSFLLLFVVLLSSRAEAQMFSYGPDRPRAVQSISFIIAPVDFNYNGSKPQATRFEFDQPAYGVRFGRTGFEFSILYGLQSARTLATPEFSSTEGGAAEVDQTRLNYVSADLLVNGRIGLWRRDENLFYLPIGLYSGYKVVGESFRGTSSGNEFNFTALGLGAGIGFSGELSPRLEISGQAMPTLGLASRSVQGLAGSARSIHVTVDAHWKNLFGRFGLTFGYGFTGQEWRINSDNFLEVIDEDIYDYTSGVHMLRLGLNF